MTTKTRTRTSLAGLCFLLAVAVVLVAALRYYFEVWPFEMKPTQADEGYAQRMDEVRSSKKGLRVLFVGNSFTANNDLPGMVRELAAGEDRPLLAVCECPGGFRLQQHWERGQVGKLLDEIRWDYLVLQEQSQLPSFIKDQRQEEMNPFARNLHAKANARGASVVLFLTWGYKDGDRHNVPDDTFAAMQERLRQGYQELAAELPATVAPAGPAWQEAVRRKPGLDLWSEDGTHPNRAGTYLAACVFYAVLYGKDPTGNGFTAGLPTAQAGFLQDVAATTVNKQSKEK